MQRTRSWLAYLTKLSDGGRDLAVYSLRWAHDRRCIQPGLQHRRVGSEASLSRDWYAAYPPSAISWRHAGRFEGNATLSARGISGAGSQ